MVPKTTWDFLQLIKSDSPPSGFSETPRHTDRPTPLLLEEKGPGDEVDATKKGPGVALNEAEGDEVDATKKGPGVALSEVEGDEVQYRIECEY
jgi:hypothetical protein